MQLILWALSSFHLPAFKATRASVRFVISEAASLWSLSISTGRAVGICTLQSRGHCRHAVLLLQSWIRTTRPGSLARLSLPVPLRSALFRLRFIVSNPQVSLFLLSIHPLLHRGGSILCMYPLGACICFLQFLVLLSAPLRSLLLSHMSRI